MGGAPNHSSVSFFDETGENVAWAEFVYPITTPAFPCQFSGTGLCSRGYAGPGEGGHMIARCRAFYAGDSMDADQDGIIDFTEILNRSNPLDGDTDDDGIMDGNEDKN